MLTTKEAKALAKAAERPTEQFHEPGAPHKVGIYVNVFQISAIDTTKEQYEIMFALNCSWLPSKDELARFQESPSDFKPDFFPKFDIVNAVSEVNVTYSQYEGRDFLFADKARFQEIGYKDIRYDWVLMSNAMIRATCREPFELEAFPMDAQDLGLTLEGQKIEVAHCVPSLLTDKLLKLDVSNVNHAEWEWADTFLEFTHTHAVASILGNHYTRTHVNFKIVRRWSMYFWRDFFFMSSTTLFSLSVFTLDPVDFYNDRLNITVALMLTLAAMNYVVQSSLPPVSYLTLMHKFVIFSFLFIMSIGSTCVALHLFEAGTDSDEAAKWIGLGAWLFFHVFAVCYAAVRRRKELKQIYHSYREVLKDHKRARPNMYVEVSDLFSPEEDGDGCTKRPIWTSAARSRNQQISEADARDTE